MIAVGVLRRQAHSNKQLLAPVIEQRITIILITGIVPDKYSEVGKLFPVGSLCRRGINGRHDSSFI